MQSHNQLNGGRREVSVLGVFSGELLIICSCWMVEVPTMMNNIWDLFLKTKLSYQVKSLCVMEQNIDSLIKFIALKEMNYLLEFIILSPLTFPPPQAF